MRVPHYKNFICEKCGNEFTADQTTKIILCPDCKRKYQKIQNKLVKSRKRAKQEAHNKFIRNMSDVHKAMRLIEDYNRQHGTNYQYGEFTHRFGI